MGEDYASEKQSWMALKEKLVRKNGWYVPSIHEKYLKREVAHAGR